MTIANSEEMLMKGLTHVWGKDEAILVLFIDVIYAKAFSCWIGESSYDIIGIIGIYFSWMILFNPKRLFIIVYNSIIIVDSLIWET